MIHLCDYCWNDLGLNFYLRAVGIDPDEDAPIVKAWCGYCQVPEDINPDAVELLRRAIDNQKELSK